MYDIQSIREQMLAKLEGVSTEREIADLKSTMFGKSGTVTGLMRELKDLPPDQKPRAGKEINDLRVELSAACDVKEKALHRAAIERTLAADEIDLTIRCGRSALSIRSTRYATN